MQLRASILLVEDEAPKRRHIEHLLKAVMVNPIITSARSVNAALDAISETSPDLMLLDMSLPTFDIGEREKGGRPQGFGGIEILRYMKMSGLDCPTIIITGYEAFPRQGAKPVELAELQKELETEFPTVLRGVLHYNSTYDEWKTALSNALAELIAKSGA